MGIEVANRLLSLILFATGCRCLLCHLPNSKGNMVEAVLLLNLFHFLFGGLVAGRGAEGPFHGKGVVLVLLHVFVDLDKLLECIGFFDWGVVALAERAFFIELDWRGGGIVQGFLDA